MALLARMQDHIVQPWEGDLLDWAAFSLRVPNADLPRLPDILAAVTPAEIARLQAGLAEVWPRFLWHSALEVSQSRAAPPALPLENACRPCLHRALVVEERSSRLQPSATSHRVPIGAGQDVGTGRCLRCWLSLNFEPGRGRFSQAMLRAGVTS